MGYRLRKILGAGIVAGALVITAGCEEGMPSDGTGTGGVDIDGDDIGGNAHQIASE